jgi:hypothetical protein
MTLYTKLLALALIPASLLALDTKASRQSLKGITGFTVEVEDAGLKTKASGVDPGKIKTTVESKLKAAGIKTLAEADAPHLSVNLDSITGKDGTVSFSLAISVLQACTLARDPAMKIPACITWSRAKTGRANEKVAAFIDGLIASEVDTFLKAYAEANPKK